MQSWAESKQQPGQFIGSTGAQVMSQAELSSGFQAWAKKVSLSFLRCYLHLFFCMWNSTKFDFVDSHAFYEFSGKNIREITR